MKKINELSMESLQEIYSHSTYRRMELGIWTAVFSGIILGLSVFFLFRENYLLSGIFAFSSFIIFLTARFLALLQIVNLIIHSNHPRGGI